MAMIDDADVPSDLRRELMDAAIRFKCSYAWLLEIFRRGRATTIGPTGQFPYGPLGPDDQGELAVAIAADAQHGVVRFEFGRPITSLALPAKHARELAAVLLAKADTLTRKMS